MTHPDPLIAATLTETAPRIRMQRAAITLRIWHHLADDARHLLFEPFQAEGRPLPLIDAMLLAAADPGARFSLGLLADQLRLGRQVLGHALVEAIADVLGESSRTTVAHAWRQVLDALFERIVARPGHRPA